MVYLPLKLSVTEYGLTAEQLKGKLLWNRQIITPTSQLINSLTHELINYNSNFSQLEPDIFRTISPLSKINNTYLKKKTTYRIIDFQDGILNLNNLKLRSEKFISRFRKD